MGVIGTISALVLGLLIASAKSSYDAKNSQVKQITANVILLDQLLAQYGPEARDARVLLRRSIASMADKIWSEGDQAAAATGSFVVSAEAETFLNSVLNLKPQTDFTAFCPSASDQGPYRSGANAPAALHAIWQRDTAAILGATRVLACYYICELQSFRVAQLDCGVCIFCLCALGVGCALSHFRT
jgi:hypothetical protein